MQIEPIVTMGLMTLYPKQRILLKPLRKKNSKRQYKPCGSLPPPSVS